jgi:Tannase-like family of unknown function (DUF6351)
MMRNIMRLAAPLVVAYGALAGFAASAQTTSQTALGIDILSSRPEFVTGGDALVRISGVASAPKVTVGANDLSGAFRPDSKGGWVGLIEGLGDGTNRLVATAGGKEATLTLVNHPLNGTLFAGPQQEPFVCENASHGLAPAADASCTAPTVVRYFYRDKGGE